MPGPDIEVGGLPLIELRAPEAAGEEPRLVSASIAPGRGMLVAQITAWIPGRGLVDLLCTPPLERLPQLLNGGPDDFNGNASFSLGGAILLPFANRIPGRPGPGRTVVATVEGGDVTLPRNWGGRQPGAETYAMHGLILAAPFRVDVLESSSVLASLGAGAFDAHWVSRHEVRVRMAISADAFDLWIEATNVGDRAAPIGIGWHPWFNLLGGDRASARLTVPATARLEVHDYDAVLPTGRVLDVEGSPYDFRKGATLGDTYLDDCFVDLARPGGNIQLAIDSGGYRIAMKTISPLVTAVQVYAPPERDIVVIEPQFNRPDPFSDAWSERGGMALAQPGQSVAYDVRTTLEASPSRLPSAIRPA